MKQKLLFALLSFMMIVATVFGLTACGSGKTVNSEFEEYETIVTTVVEKSIEALDTQSREKRDSVRAAQSLSFGKTQKDEIFSYLAGVTDKTEQSNVSFFNDVFEQSFYLPLICGYAIREHYSAEKFYDVKIALPFYDQYVKTVSDGTNKITYCYSDQNTGEDRSYMEFVVVAIDYRNENDYSFRAIQFSADFSDTLFLYGNSDLEFFALSRSDTSGEYVVYNEKGGKGYGVIDKNAVEYCYERVKDEFSQIDQSTIKSIMDTPQYTIKETEWQEANEHYLGNGNSSENTEEGHFDIRNGVLYGWTGRDEDCPASVTLPSSVQSLYYDLRFPEQVREIIIPANIQSVKVEKGVLEQLENDKAEGTDQTLVDCPLQYFSIVVISEEGFVTPLEKIEVQGTSPLFYTDNHCLYSKNGMLLYVPDSKEITSLTLDAEKISDNAMSMLEYIHLPNLVQVSANLKMVLQEEYTPEVVDPLATLFSNVYVQKSFALENLTISGITDMIGMTFGEGLISAGELVFKGQDCSDFSLIVSVPIQKLVFEKGMKAEISLSTEESGQIGEIVLPDDTVRFDCYFTESPRVTLPWSALTFAVQKKYEIFGISEYDFQLLDWDYEATEYFLERLGVTLVFTSLDDEENNDAELLKNFPDFEIIPKDWEPAYGCDFIAIEGYYGADTSINIPETMLGYPVLRFSLTEEGSEYGSPTVDGVCEVHIPGSVRDFNISTAYNLDRIVYTGTLEQFAQLNYGMGMDGVYRLLNVTQSIECSDDTLLREQTPQEQYDFTADGVSVSVKIDWNIGSVQAELKDNVQTYIAHVIEQREISDCFFEFGEISCNDEQGFPLTSSKWGLSIIFGSVSFDDETTRYWIQKISLSEFYFESDGETTKPESREVDLEKQSVTEFNGEIAHEYESEPSEVYPATCESYGSNLYHCLYCNEYYQEEIKPLGHKMGEPVQIEATCTQQAHMHRECERECCNYSEDYDYTGDYAPHDFTSQTIVQIIPSTCIHPEYRIYRCDTCGGEYGDSYGEVTGDHDYSGEDGVCAVCNRHTALFEFDYFNDGGITIKQVKERNAKRLTIPAKIGEYDVLAIDTNAFSLCETSLTGLDIDANVDETVIPVLKKLCALNNIFINSDELRTINGIVYDNTLTAATVLFVPARMAGKITLYEKTTAIAEGAFAAIDYYGTSVCNDITSIIVPAGVTEIAPNTFSGCTNLQEIEFLGAIVSIGDGAFRDCTSLTDFDFGNRLQYLGANAFTNCPLTEVRLPATLQSNPAGAFTFYMLTSFSIEEGCENYSSLTDVLYNADKTEMLAVAGGATYIYIPDSITNIRGFLHLPDYGAHQNVQRLSLPFLDHDSNSVPDYFGELTLGQVFVRTGEVPESLKIVEVRGGGIGEDAFANCTNLQQVILCEGVAFIDDYAFQSCTGLTSLVVPSTVQSIGSNAFWGCEDLTSVTLPVAGKAGQNQTTLESMFGFGGNINGITFKNHPLDVVFTGKVIGDYGFKSIVFNSLVLQEGLKTIGAHAFEALNLTEIQLPSTLQTIGANAFYDNELSSVVIPASVGLIGDEAFFSNPITQLTIEDGTQPLEIGVKAFFFTEIVNLNLPDRLVSIGDSAFSGRDNLDGGTLRSIDFGNGLQYIGEEAFMNNYWLSSIVLPDSLISVGASAFFSAGYHVGSLYIDLGQGIQEIGEAAFNGDTSVDGPIVFPDSLRKVGAYAFGGRRIRSLDLGQGVQQIGESAFWGSTFDVLTIPESLTDFAKAFFECEDITEVNIPCYENGLVQGVVPVSQFLSEGMFEQITVLNIGRGNIQANEFSGLIFLTELTLTDMEYVGESAFSGCPLLMSINIKGDDIRQSAFEDCGELINARLDVATIGAYAFRDCVKLGQMSLTERLTSVGTDAFLGCINDGNNNPFAELKIPDLVTWNNVQFANEGANPMIINTWGASLWVDGVESNDTLTIPASIKQINPYVFSWAQVEKIVVSEGTVTLKHHAFFNHFAKIVELPQSVTTVEEYAFAIMTGNIVGHPFQRLNGGEGIQYVGDYGFYGANIGFTMPQTIQHVGAYAFATFGWSELDMPNISYIGEGAFSHNSNLTYVRLGKVTALPQEAFYQCEKLTEIVLPSTLKEIGENALVCGVRRVYYEGTEQYMWDAVTIDPSNDRFDNVNFRVEIYLYSAEQPTVSGKYWKYTSLGKPMAW